MTDLNFFDDGSPFLNHPLLTPERTTLEIDFVLQQLKLQLGASILDVGCGFGRHSIELAQRGFDVIGIDPSAAMIAAARERAIETGASMTFIQTRAEEYAAGKTFDAAICLFTTLGQIDEHGDNIQLIPKIAQALKPKGLFVIEVPHRKWVINNITVEQRFGNGNHYTDVKRHYDGVEKSLTEDFTIVSGGNRKQFLLRYRLYRLEDLRYLLSKAGLNIVASFGGYDGSPLSDESPIQVVLAQKDPSKNPYSALTDIR